MVAGPHPALWAIPAVFVPTRHEDCSPGHMAVQAAAVLQAARDVRAPWYMQQLPQSCVFVSAA